MDLVNWLPGTLVGIVGIIVGIIFGYIFYCRSRRVRIPSWAVRTNNILQGYTTTLSELDIKYKDISIENLSITKILFWNDGAETIDKRDIALADLLRINAIGDTILLDASVIQVNNESSLFLVILAEEPVAQRLKSSAVYETILAVTNLHH